MSGISFNLTRLVLSLILVLSIVGSISYKIYSLDSKLSKAMITIKDLENKINNKSLLVINRDQTIEALQQGIDDLAKILDNKNIEIEKAHKELIKKQSEILKWKNKPAKERYKYIYKEVLVKDTDYSKDNCESGIKLNKSISEIKYEDL